jgi:hypothetical protein
MLTDHTGIVLLVKIFPAAKWYYAEEVLYSMEIAVHTIKTLSGKMHCI